MTARVTYLGEDDGPEELDLFGGKFPVGKSVEVDDDTAIRLMGNPFFKIDAKQVDRGPDPNPPNTGGAPPGNSSKK